jgi:hypothetical protein
MKIGVDGKFIGELLGEESLRIKLNAGPHTLRASEGVSSGTKNILVTAGQELRLMVQIPIFNLNIDIKEF